MRTTKPHVKRWKWGGANSKWCVDGLRDEQGARLRKFFPSRDEANEWLRQRRPELKNQGRAALGMTDRQRIDAVGALKLLAPYGVSLTVAARQFAERAQLLTRTVPFSELRVECIVAKKADGGSDAYINDLTHRLARFGESFDARPVSDIETREIDDWLRGLGLSPASRANYRRVLHTAFAFAVSRGYAATNPATKAALVKVLPSTPGVLTPCEIQALLDAADRKIVPSLAIAAFAGLRDAEIGRLTWAHIDIAGGHIKLDAAITKTAGRRVVPISPNLARWLTPYIKKAGPVRPKYNLFNYKCRKARALAVSALKKQNEHYANLSPWADNGLRHSYSSYRMAVVGNPAIVAEESGHSVATMKSHYRELRTKVEGEAWFAVMPAADGVNVVPFTRSAV